MISEHRFVSSFSSFWRELLPTGDAYIRNQNLQLQRFETPLDSSLPPERRSFVNELAFRLLSLVNAPNGKPLTDLSKSAMEKAVCETVSYIGRFPQSLEKKVSVPTEDEIREALLLAKRLSSFLQSHMDKGEELTFFPKFRGCGLIEECEGDVLTGSTLYEVKSGDRKFRLIDVKQLLVYCALNYVNTMYNIDRVTLLNPRVGVFLSQPLEVLARGVAGVSASELCSDLIDFISITIPSR